MPDATPLTVTDAQAASEPAARGRWVELVLQAGHRAASVGLLLMVGVAALAVMGQGVSKLLVGAFLAGELGLLAGFLGWWGCRWYGRRPREAWGVMIFSALICLPALAALVGEYRGWFTLNELVAALTADAAP